jgi:hypothetical protein
MMNEEKMQYEYINLQNPENPNVEYKNRPLYKVQPMGYSQNKQQKIKTTQQHTHSTR